MTCYACEKEPTQQCKRCGRPYCDEHGDDFCNECLRPSSGVPSFALYRGSLLALLIGTAVAVWLIVQPKSGESELIVRPTLVTATPAASGGTNILPPSGGTIVSSGSGTAVSGTPTTATPRVTPQSSTPAAGGTHANGAGGDYTVVSGDTLSAICKKVGPARLNISQCVDEIKRLNNLSSDAISVGQKLKVPQ